MGEIIFDFYDKLKSISSGYASFDYELKKFSVSKLQKLDILIHGEPVDALSLICHKDDAYHRGVALCNKLKELIPRQMFEVAIQAALNSRIIARTTVRALKKCNRQMLWRRYYKKKKIVGEAKKRKEEDENDWESGNSPRGFACCFTGR